MRKYFRVLSKNLSLKLGVCAAAAVVAFSPAAVPDAQAQYPFHAEQTLANGTNNGLGVIWTYSNGVSRSTFSRFRWTHFEVSAFPAVTNTVTFTLNRIRSGVTNPYPMTITLASNATYASIANTNSSVYGFQGDAFQWTTVYTNAFTFSQTGLEQ